VITGDGILDDFEVDDPIEGQSREDRVFCAAKEQLMLGGTLAPYRPRVRPPQCETVKMALVRKYQLFWAEMSVDQVFVFLTVLLILLQSRASALGGWASEE
jgi:hypothetical protein